jgi:transposase
MEKQPIKHYIGLDVSMKETSICIVNEKGKVVYEGKDKSDPACLTQHIQKKGLMIEKVAMESGSLSHWLVAEIRKLDIPIICVDARQMSRVLSVNVNKTDRNDARGIANALRCGYYREVSLKSQKNVEINTLLSSRKLLVEQRVSLKNGIRGMFKAYGICVSVKGKKCFTEKVREILAGQLHYIKTGIEALLDSFENLDSKIKELDKVIKEIGKEDEDVKLLTTIPGVGVITALSFKVAIDNPARFEDSRQVGAYLGMTPKQYSSGEVHRQSGISKCGNPRMRALLVEAGIVMLTRTKVWCLPKAWAFKLARKKGTKKAAVALGRKLAVIMHRMLVTREKFRFSDPEEQKEKKAA